MAQNSEKIVFIVFYDNIGYGVRLLLSVAKAAGCEPHLILFKRETGYAPLLKRGKEGPDGYQFFYNGLLRDGDYAVDRIKDEEVEILLDRIAAISPSLICLSAMSFAYEFCKEIFPNIKKRFAHIPILSGGWGPTLEPQKFLEFSDYVAVLEGEKTVQYICEALCYGRDFDDAPNLVYNKNHQLVRNPVSPPLKESDLDALPFPDFGEENKWLITNYKCLSGKEFVNHKVYDIFSSRGCPMSCSYCMASKYSNLYKSYSGDRCAKLRYRSIDVVFRELKVAIRNGATFIKFKDDVFPFHPKWLKEFLERYPKEIGLPFFCYLNPIFHKPDCIRQLKAVGLSVTMAGIQSGSQEIRERYFSRKESKEQIVEFVRLLKDLDIQYAYHLIYRNPFERESHLKESLEFVSQLPYSGVFIFMLVLFPGLPLKKRIEDERPEPIAVLTSEWYALLHSLSLQGPFYRTLAKMIYRLNIFRSHPKLMSGFFLVPLMKEFWTRFLGRYVRGTQSYFTQKSRCNQRQKNSNIIGKNPYTKIPEANHGDSQGVSPMISNC